jgi:hypothetical protein
VWSTLGTNTKRGDWNSPRVKGRNLAPTFMIEIEPPRLGLVELELNGRQAGCGVDLAAVTAAHSEQWNIP